MRDEIKFLSAQKALKFQEKQKKNVSDQISKKKSSIKYFCLPISRFTTLVVFLYKMFFLILEKSLIFTLLEI